MTINVEVRQDRLITQVDESKPVAEIVTLNVGPAGPPGVAGPTGAPGAPGVSGPTGPQGESGPTGPASTVPGPTGPASTVPGPTGPQGEKGDKGDQGDVGPTGQQGEKGEKGDKGDQGDVGPTGAASTVPGPTGPASTVPGPTGPQGEKGDKGDKGDQGDVGPTGPASTVPGPTGPQGVSGPSGPQGEAATLDVGTVTVVNPDQSPDVTNSGTVNDAIFDFDLPRAPAVSVGTVGTVGPTAPATVTDVGTDGDVVLDFEIPQGEKGDKGDQGDVGPTGPQGPSGPAGPSGIQGEPGPTGQQGVSGPAGPSGAQGEPGPTGQQGVSGPTGPQGVSGPAGPTGGPGVVAAEAPITYDAMTQTVGFDGELSDLNDVDTYGAAPNDLLEYDGTEWVPTSEPSVGRISFATTSPPSLDAAGDLAWDDLDQALSYRTNGITVDIAQENLVYVRNATGNSTIPKGAAVAVLGAAANRLTVQLCDSTVGGDGCRTLGVAITDIPSPGFGFVSTFGLLRGFNTANIIGGGVVEGSELFISSTPGVLSTQPQASPGRRVTVGYVVTTGTQGSIFVTVRRGLKVNELDDVLATGPADGQVLAYNLSEGRFELASPPLGPTGPTGPASTVPGPTGPSGPAGPSGASFSATVSATAPTGPSVGDLWLESSSGDYYVYIDDGDSQQWVELGNPGPTGPASTVPGPTGPTGPSGVGVQYFETTVDVYDWTEGTGAEYVAVLPITGLLDTDRPLVTLDLSGVDIQEVQDVAVEFQTVYRVEASDDDELTLYATSIPTVDFDLLIQVVR